MVKNKDMGSNQKAFLSKEKMILRQPEVPQNKTNLKQVAAFMAGMVKYQRSLWKKEMQDLFNARALALNIDNPRRYNLAQIYHDVALDMFFKAQVNLRINRIKNKKFKIVSKSGETDIEKTKLLKKRWFKQFLKFSIEAKFWGFRLPYIFVDQNGQLSCKAVWPEHVAPEQGLLLRNPFDIDGYPFREAPLNTFCVPIGYPEDLGLYESLAYGFILKKHSWQSWDEFEELFGVPMRIAKTASQDKAVQEEILSWLEDMGSASYGLFPIDTEIELKENKQTDAFEVFDQKRKAVNEEAALLINGNAESSNNSGSRAKAEAILKNTTDQITEDDKGDCEDIVNDDLLPLLSLHFGFPFADGDRFEWDDADAVPIKDMADVLTKVSEMGFELDIADVSAKLGVKILGKKEPVVDPAKKGIEPEEDDKKKKPTPPKKATKADNVFRSILTMHNEVTNLLTDHAHGE